MTMTMVLLLLLLMMLQTWKHGCVFNVCVLVCSYDEPTATTILDNIAMNFDRIVAGLAELK